tara:strand:- start:152 stop:478 length:327 start_codon:yes stop_codon:yes gene_type:complete
MMKKNTATVNAENIIRSFIMPKVGNKSYSYDAKGIAMAKNAAKSSGQPINMKHGGKVKKMMGGGSVEVDGVMQEHYAQPMDASMADENSGFSRGGGAALRGTRFRGVK